MDFTEAGQKFTFHLVSLPHSQTTKDYTNCAFTEKTRKFADMMKSLGHTVYLYASEDNEAACDELITCITKEEQQKFVGVYGPEDILKAPFDVTMPHWQVFNHRTIEGIRARAQKTDFICIIGGLCQKPVADAFPEMMTVEFGIGYPGVFANYKVFESYAWMNATYGGLYGNAGARPSFYDRIIPSYFEPELFPVADEQEDYFLFIGRLVQDKGVGIAIETAKALGKRLVVAGLGDYPLPDWVEYKGLVGPEGRADIMSKAIASFVPSLYIEPFGSVAPEALMCGTPIITTDWGAFPEINQQGKTGFLCRSFQEFVDAAENIGEINRTYCRDYAMGRYTVDVVRWLYQKYFEDLYTLWGDGWYTRRKDDALVS